MAAAQVSSDVRRTVNQAERDSGGGARPLSDEVTDAKVLAGRLRGIGSGSPGPAMRMGEANAAGGGPRARLAVPNLHRPTGWLDPWSLFQLRLGNRNVLYSGVFHTVSTKEIACNPSCRGGAGDAHRDAGAGGAAAGDGDAGQHQQHRVCGRH